ncbi:MAG TPA: hypothetical protein VHU83_11455 [Bryobacteraceae bacterium]|nr:hypothetical protein [Bryobacteraceae bacterium]
MDELGEVKLGWTPYGGQWCALLVTEKSVDADRLARLFADRVKPMKCRPEFDWSPALKDVSPEALRERSQLALSEGLAEWFQAFGCELSTSKDGKLQSTPFDMTVARQLFLANAAWLTKNLATPDKRRGDAPNIVSFAEALFGPWKYQDDQHSLGWDPSTILMGAFTPKAPTAMNKAGVRAAVWLAMESLPFFPCFYDSGLATTGFKKQGRDERFSWPIWEAPLTVASARVLIEHSITLQAGELSTRGIAAVYTSQVFKPNKYLTSFQPAVLQIRPATSDSLTVPTR